MSSETIGYWYVRYAPQMIVVIILIVFTSLVVTKLVSTKMLTLTFIDLKNNASLQIICEIQLQNKPVLLKNVQLV